MPHSTPADPPTTSDISQARELLAQAGATAGLDRDRSAGVPDMTAVNRDFGRSLPAFAQAAGEALAEAGDALGLPDAEESIRRKTTLVEDLDALRGDAEQIAHLAAQAGNAARVDLAGAITRVYQAADAVALHPAVPAEKKEKVARATVALNALRDARKGEFRSSQLATRAQNEHASDKAAAATRIAGLETELSQARLENTVLSGQMPRAADRTVPAPVAAAPASAPRLRRRPGRAR